MNKAHKFSPDCYCDTCWGIDPSRETPRNDLLREQRERLKRKNGEPGFATNIIGEALRNLRSKSISP